MTLGLGGEMEAGVVATNLATLCMRANSASVAVWPLSCV